MKKAAGAAASCVMLDAHGAWSSQVAKMCGWGGMVLTYQIFGNIFHFPQACYGHPNRGILKDKTNLYIVGKRQLLKWLIRKSLPTNREKVVGSQSVIECNEVFFSFLFLKKHRQGLNVHS